MNSASKTKKCIDECVFGLVSFKHCLFFFKMIALNEKYVFSTMINSKI